MPLFYDAYLVLYEFISLFFPSFVSLILGAINQGLSCALPSDSCIAVLFIHLPVGLRYVGICWEGILISCNFPCTGMYGSEVWSEVWQAEENTDVDSMEWQMKNGCESANRVYSHQVSRHTHIWRTHCTDWRIREQKHYLFFILRLELRVLVWDMSYYWAEQC